MNEQYNPKLTANSKALRRNMTPQERHLWYDCLKLLPVTVHRQKVLGPYIVDFYIAQAKIVIELDGSQHYQQPNQQQDILRDQALQELGCLVLRYSNADIGLRFREVCQDIEYHLSARLADSPWISR